MPPIADDDEQILNSDGAKAYFFNNFFIGIGKKLAGKIETSDNSPEKIFTE